MYICVERLVTSDNTNYLPKDTISDEAYAYLQPNEREHFEKIIIKKPPTPSRPKRPRFRT